MSRTHYYGKNVERKPYSDAHVVAQLRSTKALLKFCYEHGRSDEPYIRSIEMCASALEERDIASAVTHYLEVPIGGNGCFNDWWPPVVYEHETEDYAWAVFEALTSSWFHAMELSVARKI